MGLLVLSFVLLSLAVAWAYYLEKKTQFPPIMRISIITRHHYRVAVVYFVVVSTDYGNVGVLLTGPPLCVVLLQFLLRWLHIHQSDLLSALRGHETNRDDHS